MSPNKQQKVNNFASTGRVLGTGEVKPSGRSSKKSNTKTDDEDYVPPNNEGKGALDLNDVSPTGSKRKRETNDDDNSELQESIPILKAQRTATKDIADVGMTEKAKKILSLVDLTNRRSANQALKENSNENVKDETKPTGKGCEKKPEELKKPAEDVKGALRYGKNRDGFVNRYGHGHSLE